MGGTVDEGRQAFERRAWAETVAHLSLCEQLAAEDLERLAVAAHLIGRDDDSARAWQAAYREHLRLDNADRAARCAFWLALALMLRGEMAPAGGWLARAERHIESGDAGDGARGLVIVPACIAAIDRGEHAAALDLAVEMVDRGERSGDSDLLAFGLLGRGQALIAKGEITRGMKSFDEAMVAVTTGEVSPIPAGIVYCAVIDACMRASDLRRAAEWTDALDGWCTSQPDLVPYRGQCLVHRSQVLLAHGEWTEAMNHVDRARERLSEPPHPALGLALYQQGELLRLRGDFVGAERAYREASELGHEPAPGFALLRLAEGKIAAAEAAIRRMLDESRGRFDRPVILAAAVDVLLAAGEAGGARHAAGELDGVARTAEVPLLRAMSAYTTGIVRLADGDASAALSSLREAASTWRELGMVYDAARARVHVALACRELGDHDAATLELDGAQATFERLGAAADVERVTQLAGRQTTSAALSDRECEVLRLVAGGLTNREIAASLIISEHTVARHLQNIFMKLGLSSRAAATAYAYEHGLV